MIKVAVIGTGGMGKVHISNYKHMDNCTLVAVCDQRIDNLDIDKSVSVFNDVDEMLNKVDIDLVDICTPTFVHKQNVLAAINAGKNVICEKPLALTSKDAVEIFEAAEQKGVKVFVGQVLQYSKEAMRLKEIVAGGKYGKLKSGSFSRLSFAPAWIKSNWLFDKNLSGGVGFDLHIHDLDLIVSLFGKPKKYSCYKCNSELNPKYSHHIFSYEYEDKIITAEAGWLSAQIPFTVIWRLYFEKAVVELSNGEMSVYTDDSSKKQIINITDDLLIPTGINIPPTGMFLRELTDFTSQLDENYCGCKRKTDILTVLEILESTK